MPDDKKEEPEEKFVTIIGPGKGAPEFMSYKSWLQLCADACEAHPEHWKLPGDLSAEINQIAHQVIAHRYDAIEAMIKTYLANTGLTIDDVELVEENRPNVNQIAFFVQKRTDK